MANVNRFLDPEDPSVERWLQILEDESDLEAVIVLVTLILDNLKDPCLNKLAHSFCLPGQIGDRFNFARFVEANIHGKEFEMPLLVSNGEWLARFFEKIIDKSDNVSWMLELSKVFRVLIINDCTKFFIEYALIEWYMELLNIPLANHNSESIRILNEVCNHLTETIVKHVNAFSVHRRIFTRFVENIDAHMIRNFSKGCVCGFRNILKYPDCKLISKTMETILRITINNEYVTTLFTAPSFVTALNTIILQDFPAETLDAALILATRIQKKKPLQKLFSTRMFQNYLIESNIKLRKSCADLFKATFEVPFDPNSISLLEKLVLIFTKLESDDATVDCLVGSFSEEFTDWDKIYRVTLAQSNNQLFLIDLWDYLVNGTMRYIRKRDPNEADYHLILFMHKGIDFLDECDMMENKFIYGLIISFIAIQDKRLQMVDLAHRQKLAHKLVEIPLNQPFEIYKHEYLAKNLMKALMIQKIIDQNAAAKQAEHLLKENIFEEAVQLLTDPNFDFEHNPILCNKFMSLATMAKSEILQGQVAHVAIMTYNLLSHLKDLKRNLNFWSYTIMSCVESCTYIISKCKRRVDSHIDLNKVFYFLFDILTKCNGQVNFFTYTVFGSLCRMESLKIHTGRPQNLNNFIAFINDAIDTFISNKELADFPFHYLDSMIRQLAYVLALAPHELNFPELVVKVFQTFPAEDYVYLFVGVLAKRFQHEAFVKSVVAIFLTFPPVKEYKKFAKRTNEIIERIAEPRRKELRTKFNGALVKEFSLQNIQHFTETKIAKATRMAKVIADTMIDPYLQRIAP